MADADAERYVTLSELQSELPFDARDFPMQDAGAFDGACRRSLESASDLVEEWTGAVFETQTATKSLSRRSTLPEYILPLPEAPVQSVESVTVSTRDTEMLLAETDDYVVEETYLELDTDPASDLDEWPASRRSIAVEWTYGYESCPAPVQEAIIRLARNRLDQIETDGVNTESSWQYRPPAKIKHECIEMISPYDAPSYSGGATVI